jgi:hypothetical protein
MIHHIEHNRKDIATWIRTKNYVLKKIVHHIENNRRR